MISRRRLHLLVMLLLPFMALRAFLPAGYMLAPGAGADHWALVLCSEGLAAQVAAAAAGGAHDHQLPPAADHSDHCPFAMATAAALPASSSGWVPAPSFTVHASGVVADELPPATGPPRQAPARAPPALHA